MERNPDKDTLDVNKVSDALVVLHLTSSEMQIIDEAIRGYMGYLKRMHGINEKQHQLLQDMARVQMCIAHVQKGLQQEVPPVSFDFGDLEVMTDVLSGFVRLIARMVPKSKERDEVLQGLRFLRQKIETSLDAMISSHQEA